MLEGASPPNSFISRELAALRRGSSNSDGVDINIFATLDEQNSPLSLSLSLSVCVSYRQFNRNDRSSKIGHECRNRENCAGFPRQRLRHEEERRERERERERGGECRRPLRIIKHEEKERKIMCSWVQRARGRFLQINAIYISGTLSRVREVASCWSFWRDSVELWQRVHVPFHSISRPWNFMRYAE